MDNKRDMSPDSASGQLRDAKWFVLEDYHAVPVAHEQTGGLETALSVFTDPQLAAPLLEVESGWQLRALQSSDELASYLHEISPEFTHVMLDPGQAGTRQSFELPEFLSTLETSRSATGNVAPKGENA